MHKGNRFRHAFVLIKFTDDGISYWENSSSEKRESNGGKALPLDSAKLKIEYAMQHQGHNFTVAIGGKIDSQLDDGDLEWNKLTCNSTRIKSTRNALANAFTL